MEFFAYERGFSPIFVTAAVSLVALLAVVASEVNGSFLHAKTALSVSPLANVVQTAPADTNPYFAPETADATSTPTDPLSSLGSAIIDHLSNSYAQMQQSGTYSASSGELAAQSLAPYVRADVSYSVFTAAEVKTDTDTSYARMLQYRTGLRDAFAPLLKNTTPEFEIYASYVDTKDVSYLTKLEEIAGQYREAVALTKKVSAPSDAIGVHVDIVNAMEQFAATLDAMSAHATDPFASVALLRSYEQAESNMLSSFNALTIYYKSKKL